MATRLTLRALLGWSLIGVSTIAWTALPVIPFLPISVAAKASWGAGVFVFAEITWWAAIPLLGKELIDFWQKTVAWAKRQLGRDDAENERDSDEQR